MNTGFGGGITYHTDGLTRAFAGSGIGLGPLPTHRQTAAMAESPITADISEAGDILLHLPAQGALDRIFAVQDARQAADIVVGQLLGTALRIDVSLFAKPERESSTGSGARPSLAVLPLRVVGGGAAGLELVSENANISDGLDPADANDANTVR